MCEAEEGKDIESGLHLAFKKLKVDPEWNADMMLTPNKKNAVHHLWIRKESQSDLSKKPNGDTTCSKAEKSAELEDGQSSGITRNPSEGQKESQPKLKIAVVKPTRRSAPYPHKDDFLSLSKLTFTDETCQKKSCSCSHKTQPSSSKGLFLNYARACVQSKYKVQQPVLRQARFRSHNKHKDHKSVIRAARLKILRTHTPKIGKPLPQGSNLANRTIFGANQNKHKDLSFSALAVGSIPSNSESGTANGKLQNPGKPDNTKPKSIKLFSGNSFEKHRSVSVVAPYSIQGRVIVEGAEAAAKDDEGATAQSSAAETGATAALDLSSLTESLLSSSQSDSAKKSSEACFACPIHPRRCLRPCTCATQARLDPDDLTMDELACYFEDFVHIPKKMSSMAEMMYT